MNPLGKWLTWRAAAWSARASARPRGARRARSRAGGWAWPARSGKRPPVIPTDFMAASGDVLYNVYGTTEISVPTIATPTDLRRAPESVGVAPPGIRVSVLDDDLHVVPDGVTGRIFVHNPMARADYADGSGRAAQHHGMQFTGDFGHVRDGLLFVDGREDEVVISGGQNVFPAELERALGHHPDVREVAAIGLPDREHGNRLVAFVVPRDPDVVHEAALIAYAKLEVTELRVPRQVLFVDALPRNDMGRVIGDGLRQVATVGS